MPSFGLSSVILCCAASVAMAAPPASTSSTVKVNTIGSNGTASNGAGSVSASGALVPFGDIGVGCGINWAEGTSFGGKSLSSSSGPRCQPFPPVPSSVCSSVFPRRTRNKPEDPVRSHFTPEEWTRLMQVTSKVGSRPDPRLSDSVAAIPSPQAT